MFKNFIFASYFGFGISRFRALAIRHCYDAFDSFFEDPKHIPSTYGSIMTYKGYEVEIILRKPETTKF